MRYNSLQLGEAGLSQSSRSLLRRSAKRAKGYGSVEDGHYGQRLRHLGQANRFNTAPLIGGPRSHSTTEVPLRNCVAGGPRAAPR